jgi:outer membrane receptor protein involved in Fe transport
MPLAQQAAAQTAVPSADADSTEVVITAQKREQNRLEVPITVSAFKGSQLDKQGVKDLHDLSALTPGFYVQNQSPNDPGIVMRGITDDSVSATDEPRVSIYQDGVSISRPSSAFTELYDLERVEVDKGPQTTLYGRSALTGAVDIIENKATEKGLDWNLKAEGGNFNYHSLEGMINLPLSDHFAIRFSGMTLHRDGYIKNVLGGEALNGEDANSIRMAFNYRGENVKNDLLVSYEDGDPSAVAFKSTTFAPSNPTTGAVLGNTSPWTAAALNNSPAIFGGKPLGISRHIVSATDIATWTLSPALKLTSTLAARADKSTELFDPDGFSFPILTAADQTRGRQVSEELRLNYDNAGRFSGFAGASLFDEHASEYVPTAFDERATLALLTGVLNRTNPTAGPLAAYTDPNLMAAELEGLLNSGGLNVSNSTALGLANNLQAAHYEESTDTGKTRSYDLFMDGTFHATGKLEFSAGVRYSHDDKTSGYQSRVGDRSILGGVIGLEETAKALGLNPATTGNCTIPPVAAANPLCQLLGGMATRGASSLSFPAAIPFFGITSQPTAGNGDLDKAGLSDDGASWRLTSRYAVSDTQNFYATYSHGRRPEVLTAASPISPFGPAVFSPEAAETMDNYEGGYKANYFDHRLAFDGAIYTNNYRHFSATVLNGTQFVNEDAGKANTYGLETTVTYAPTSDLSLYLAYAYTHGRFGNGLLKGNHFRLTPDHSLNLGADYRVHGLGGVFEVLPSYSYKSKYFLNDDNGKAADQNFIIPSVLFNQYQNAYGVLDLRLGYSPNDKPWRIELFATNLTNQKYLKDAGNTGSDLGLPTYIPGEPRFYGVTFSIHR